jgi:hypothetical protein
MHGRQPDAQHLDPGMRTTSPVQRAYDSTRPVTRAAGRPANHRPLFVLGGVVAAVAVLAVAFGGRGGDADGGTLAIDAGAPATEAPQALFPAGSVPADQAVADPTLAAVAPGVAEAVAERPSVDLEGCMLDVLEIGLGDSGESVECLQKALYAGEYYDGEFSGTFDAATDVAVRAVQSDRDLYVDGVVGRQTAESLGIWPGDESFVVKTPRPEPGATDLWGMALSPVASAGDDAPPMPEDTGQGTGYRIVYSRAMQRVWAVNDAEDVVRSYLVSGSQYHNEVPGRHEVYSRSETTTAWNGAADLPLMVRWLDTERGAIGFHAIPNHRDTGEPYQTTDELGDKLSGGCQRQHMLDAQFMWAFGEVGTPVYVV